MTSSTVSSASVPCAYGNDTALTAMPIEADGLEVREHGALVERVELRHVGARRRPATCTRAPASANARATAPPIARSAVDHRGLALQHRALLGSGICLSESALSVQVIGRPPSRRPEPSDTPAPRNAVTSATASPSYASTIGARARRRGGQQRGLAAGRRRLEAPGRAEDARAGDEGRDVSAPLEPGLQRRHREARVLAQQRDDRRDVGTVPGVDEGPDEPGAPVAQRSQRRLLRRAPLFERARARCSALLTAATDASRISAVSDALKPSTSRRSSAARLLAAGAGARRRRRAPPPRAPRSAAAHPDRARPRPTRRVERRAAPPDAGGRLPGSARRLRPSGTRSDAWVAIVYSHERGELRP